MGYKSRSNKRRTTQRNIIENQGQNQEESHENQRQSNSPHTSFSNQNQEECPRSPNSTEQHRQSMSPSPSVLSSSSISSISQSASNKQRSLSYRNRNEANASSCQSELRAHSSFHQLFEGAPHFATSQTSSFHGGRVSRSQTITNFSDNTPMSGKQPRMKMRNLERAYEVNEQRIQHLEQMVHQLTSELSRHGISSNENNLSNSGSNSSTQSDSSRSPKKKSKNENSQKSHKK